MKLGTYKKGSYTSKRKAKYSLQTRNFYKRFREQVHNGVADAASHLYVPCALPFFDKLTLASYFDIPEDLLDSITSSNSNANYSTFFIDKKTNKIVPYSVGSELREINAPHRGLKDLQLALMEVFKVFPMHPCNHAFMEGKGIRSAAESIKEGESLIHADIRHFFDEHTSLYVKSKLKELLARTNTYISGDALNAIVALCCKSNHLPQGSPCSPLLTIILNYDMDVRISNLAESYGITYTRYADDMWFSGKISNDRIKDFKLELANAVHPFRLNYKKFGIMRESAAPILRGIKVTFKYNIPSSHSAKIIELFRNNLQGMTITPAIEGRTMELTLKNIPDVPIDDIKAIIKNVESIISAKYPKLVFTTKLKFFYIQSVKKCLGMNIVNNEVKFPRKEYNKLRLTAYMIGKQKAFKILEKSINEAMVDSNTKRSSLDMLNIMAENYSSPEKLRATMFAGEKEEVDSRYRNLYQRPLRERVFKGKLSYLHSIDAEKADKLSELVKATTRSWINKCMERIFPTQKAVASGLHVGSGIESIHLTTLKHSVRIGVDE